MIHDPATYRHGVPYDHLRELRATAPVTHHDHPVWEDGYWFVVRHADVGRVSREVKYFHNAPHPFLDIDPGDSQGSSGLLISLDAPEHYKMRSLVSRGFTPKRVADLEGAIRRRVDALMDNLVGRDRCDLVEDLALWLPLHVIADLVGVPEPDRRQVFAWTETAFGFDPAVTQQDKTLAAMAMYAYAEEMCRERQEHPRDDLMSVLLAAEVDGEKLTQMQIDLFFLLLQSAGSETTRNLITSGTVALLQHPDQLARLRDDMSLLPAAIEELLRFTTPVLHFARTVAQDVEVAGQPMRPGERVVISYVSANRDETVFDDPDGLDVTRKPNPHVSFGAGGPHYCLGASLARLEAQAMFEAILTRMPGLELVDDPATLPRLHSNLVSGFSHVDVRFDAVLPSGAAA